MNLYLSSKEENSPLGWMTVRKKIKEVSDHEFLDHFKRFYESEDKPVKKVQRPGILGSLDPSAAGASILAESKTALFRIAVISAILVAALWWAKTQL